MRAHHHRPPRPLLPWWPGARLVALLVACALLLPAAGHAQGKGYVGLEVRNIEQAEAETLGWEGPRGASVVTLFEDGPAINAGVAAGDIILSVDGTEVESIEDFVDLISTKSPGTSVRLRLLRAGKERRVTMVLATRPASQPLPETCAKFMPNLGRSIEVPCPD